MGRAPVCARTNRPAPAARIGIRTGQFNMSDGNSITATGITETRRSDGVVFHVAQNKYGQLVSAFGFMAGTMAVGLMTTSFVMQGDVLGLVIGAIILFFTAIAALISFITFLTVLVSLPARKDRAEFAVGKSGVELIVKQKGGYPARIAVDHIQSLYIKTPSQAPRYGHVTVVAGSAGMVAAQQGAHAAAAVGGGLGQLLGSSLAKTSWSVAITAYGQEVLLATWLTESQASYLMHRVERAFAI